MGLRGGWALFACVVALAGCSGGGSAGPPAGADGGSPPQDATAGGTLDGAVADGAAGACAADPLRTGLTAQQTGVSVDAFDCPILQWAAAYSEPDPMIFKAIIYVESRFDEKAVACPNLPCGTPMGWTAMKSGCFGLMQIVPACGSLPGDAGLLPSGHPDLTTDSTAPGWAESVFNPDVNVRIGIAGISVNRAQEMQKFPGCTTDQYTLMAVGDYNSYGSTKSCTTYNKAYDDSVLAAYQMYATAAGYVPHAY